MQLLSLQLDTNSLSGTLPSSLNMSKVRHGILLSNIPCTLHHRQCGDLCYSHTAIALLCHQSTWAAQYSAWLLIKLMLKGVVFDCIFLPVIILGKGACALTVLEKT